MRKPPLSIAIVAALFLAVGCLDLYRGLAPLFTWGRLHGDDATVLALGVAAVLGAAFLLLGHGWARWLLAAWMALHVAISIGHPRELLMHAAIFALLLFILFRPAVREHFRGASSTR